MNNNKIDYEVANEACEQASAIDFGAVFADAQVCDYTPCLQEITRFIPSVVSLIGRKLCLAELRQCERMLRQQYLQHRPFCINTEFDEYIYGTPWSLDDGTQICIQATLRRLSSITVLDADKKLCRFSVCDAEGNPIMTLANLPWQIENLREVRFALRSLWQARFPHDVLGSGLAAGWRAAGAREDLPQAIALRDLPDGRALTIRFTEAPSGSEEDAVPKAHATLLVDGCEVTLQELLPPMLQRIDPTALDENSMADFYDMQGGLMTESYADWIYRRLQTYAYLVTIQQKKYGMEAVIPCLCQNEPTEIFHSGEYSVDGEAIYGLCRSCQDGRWTSVVWSYASQLRDLGISRLPVELDWRCEWHAFDPSGKISPLSDHVLDHAHRWAPTECLTGKRDRYGNDIFVNAATRDLMLRAASDALGRSLRYAAESPECISYGYYSSIADRKREHGRASPIAIYIPALFPVEAGFRSDSVFAIRVVRDDAGRIWYEIPTILTREQANRCINVLSDDIGLRLRLAS